MTVRSRFNARHVLLLLIGALVVVRLAAMAVLPLMDTTEARYGEIGRMMVDLGDWVTPWFEPGVPFWGKPPLSFWLTAASFKLFGVGEFAARLPHFLCAVGVAMLVWDLARRRDRREAVLAVAVLAGSALFFVSSGAVMTDGALVAGTTLAMRGFWSAMQATPAVSTRRRGCWLFFVGLAAALLAKGPVALVLIGAPLFAWTLLSRRWADAGRALPWAGGSVLLAAIVMPWYVLAELRTPGFLKYFLLGEHWHRFVTPGWKGDLFGTAHSQARGTIWLHALLALLPWSILLPFAAFFSGRAPRGLGATAQDRDWQRFLLLWALTPVLFFTAARNIIWTYVLPGLPAAALLIASRLARSSPRAERWAAAGLAISLLVAGATILEGVMRSDRSAKPLVEAYRRERGNGEPLIFVASRPYSAAFYSRGHAQRVASAADLRLLLQPIGAFVAVPAGTSNALEGAGIAVESRFGQFGAFELFRVRCSRQGMPAEPAVRANNRTSPPVP